MDEKKCKYNSFREFVEKSACTKVMSYDEVSLMTKYLNTPSTVSIHILVDTITLLLGLYDGYTAKHSYRVAFIAEQLSRKFERSEAEHQRLHIAAHLHDIGKISVPSHILNKKGRLTNEEFIEVMEHSRKGYEVIQRVEALSSLAEIILHHHERFEGTGYPNGIKGADIPFDSRIIAVADSFDAMTTDRPYHKGLSSEEALQEVKRCSGAQFDPVVVAAFEDVFNKILCNVNSENI